MPRACCPMRQVCGDPDDGSVRTPRNARLAVSRPWLPPLPPDAPRARAVLFSSGGHMMPTEKRACARHQVRKAARIIFFDEPCFIDCTIRNISEDGALVSMPLSVGLPNHVLLWEER